MKLDIQLFGGRGASSSTKKINKIPQKVIDNFLEKNATKGNFYIATISPDDFLKLTASQETIKSIEKSVDSGMYGELDLKKLNKNYMMLEIDLRNGNVINHEGRHRMQLLKNNGYEKAEIIISSLDHSYWYENNPNKDFKHNFSSLHLKSQSKSSDFRTTITNLKYLKKK